MCKKMKKTAFSLRFLDYFPVFPFFSPVAPFCVAESEKRSPLIFFPFYSL